MNLNAKLRVDPLTDLAGIKREKVKVPSFFIAGIKSLKCLEELKT